MQANTSNKISHYTQGRQFAARVLLTVWLLASGSPEGVLAGPQGQPAIKPSPQGFLRLLFTSCLLCRSGSPKDAPQCQASKVLGDPNLASPPECPVIPYPCILSEVSLGLETLTKEGQQLMQYAAYLDAYFRQEMSIWPEVSLNLETLTKKGQQLMQYAAYLDADFIPLSLVSVVLEEDDLDQLIKVVRELSGLSLMQVVSTQEGDPIGLQVSQDIQAVCREYEGWSPEAALGKRETILLQLAKILGQILDVASAQNDSWQHAKLYVYHVVKVVDALENSGATPSAVLARLLFFMGHYRNHVGRNYRQAVSYYERALAIYEQVYQETPNHPAIAWTLDNLGYAYYALGDAHQAVGFYERALAIYKQVYHATSNHPDITRTLYNLKIASKVLKDASQDVGFYEQFLAIFKQIYDKISSKIHAFQKRLY